MERNKQHERGMALVMALIALLIVTSIGLSLMFMADTETSINGNYRDEQKAYYAAKTGLEETRDRMRAGATDTISANLPATLPGSTNGALYILNPTGSETVAPWNTADTYFDDEICKEVSCGTGNQVPTAPSWYTTANASTTYAATPTLPYKWTRISLKTDQSASGWSGGTQNFMYVDGKSANASYYTCWNGAAIHEIAQSSACVLPYYPVYTLTALAKTPSGTRRMLQYEVTRDSLIQAFPSALTLDGTDTAMTAASSNPYKVDGTDHAGCGGVAAQPTVAGVGVTNNTDVTTVTTAIPTNRQSNYTGSGSTTPNVQNVSSSMPLAFQSVSGLQTLLATIQSNANQVLTGPVTSLSNPGTASSPQTIYVNGDLTLSGSVTGYGVLVVTGTYTASGTVGWNGIVLVVGQGIVNGTGGGSNSYNGAFFVAKTVNAEGTPLSTLGAPTFNWSGGGGNGIYYSSACIAQAAELTDYQMVSTREMMY